MAELFKCDQEFVDIQDFFKLLDDYESATNYKLRIWASRTIKQYCNAHSIINNFGGDFYYYEIYIDCVCGPQHNKDRLPSHCSMKIKIQLSINDRKYIIKNWQPNHNHDPSSESSGRQRKKIKLQTWADRMTALKEKYEKDENGRLHQIEVAFNGHIFKKCQKKIKRNIMKSSIINQKVKITLLNELLVQFKEWDMIEMSSDESHEDAVQKEILENNTKDLSPVSPTCQQSDGITYDEKDNQTENKKLKKGSDSSTVLSKKLTNIYGAAENRQEETSSLKVLKNTNSSPNQSDTKLTDDDTQNDNHQNDEENNKALEPSINSDSIPLQIETKSSDTDLNDKNIEDGRQTGALKFSTDSDVASDSAKQSKVITFLSLILNKNQLNEIKADVVIYGFQKVDREELKSFFDPIIFKELSEMIKKKRIPDVSIYVRIVKNPFLLHSTELIAASVGYRGIFNK
ncbi:Protein of unknown function [Cotesia congregata]|uniref:ZSWIM3 N-terminal domain-containing protein n=1 Tax=Cotesia congregata TaxID=51543 RepID=A0A8J2H6X0_COTCN|nr:Protein of unknown function [Cotesia congregata]